MTLKESGKQKGFGYEKFYKKVESTSYKVLYPRIIKRIDNEEVISGNVFLSKLIPANLSINI